MAVRRLNQLIALLVFAVAPARTNTEASAGWNVVEIPALQSNLLKSRLFENPMCSLLSEHRRLLFAKLTFLAFAVMLAPVGTTYGASGDLDSPSVALPASLAQADREKIHAVLQRKGCTFISGNFLNKDSQLHYKSDTESLGKFLEELSQCSGLTIHLGFYRPGPDARWAVDDSNWSVFHSARDNSFAVKIRLGSDIDLATLHIPALTSTPRKESKTEGNGIGLENKNSGLALANSGLRIGRFTAIGGSLSEKPIPFQQLTETANKQKMVGSVLVANTTEPAHHRIEALLHKLSQVSRAKPVASATPQPSLPSLPQSRPSLPE
jgi:hypothetical protein